MNTNQSKKSYIPIVAQMICANFGVKLVFDNTITTPMTDGKTIRFPVHFGNSSTLDEDVLIRGFLAHEGAGHVRHTDFEYVPEWILSKPPKLHSILKHLENTIEDIRIEKAAIKAYPGCKKLLSEVIDMVQRVKPEHFNMPPGVTDIGPFGALSGFLLNKLRKEILNQNLRPEPFEILMLDKFGKDLTDKIYAEAVVGSLSDSTKSVCDSVDRIIAMIQEAAKDEPEPDQDEPESGDEGDSSESGDEGDAGEQGESGSSDNGGESQGQGGKGKPGKKSKGEKSESSKDEGDENSGDDEGGDQGDGQGDSGDSGDESDSGDNSGGDGDEGSDDGSDSSKSSSDGKPGKDGGKGNPKGKGQKSEGGDAKSDEPGKLDGEPEDGRGEKEGAEERAKARESAKDLLDTKPADIPKSGHLEDLLGEMIDKVVKNNQRVMGRTSEVPYSFSQHLILQGNNTALVASSEQRGYANKIGARLEDMLQAKVDNDDQIGRSGNIAPRLLHRTKVADMNVFRLEGDENEDLDTAFYIMVDESGSMTSQVDCYNTLKGNNEKVSLASMAIDSLVAVCESISRFDVPFGISYFNSNVTDVKSLHSPWHSVKGHVNKYKASGGTPITAAITHAVGKLAHCRNSRKIALIITDGTYSVNFEPFVNSAKEAKIEIRIVVIGQGQSVEQTIQSMRKAGCVVSQAKLPTEIPQSIFEVMKTSF